MAPADFVEVRDFGKELIDILLSQRGNRRIEVEFIIYACVVSGLFGSTFDVFILHTHSIHKRDIQSPE